MSNERKFVARMPVLYLAHQYSAGDELPTNNQTMMEAWIASGAAAWVEETTSTSAKAKPATAPSGMFGISSDGDPDALVGRITPTEARKTAKKTGKKK